MPKDKCCEVCWDRGVNLKKIEGELMCEVCENRYVIEKLEEELKELNKEEELKELMELEKELWKE